MLEYFVTNEMFVRELLDGNNQVQLSDEDWLFIKEYVQVFQPVYYATLRLQNESLTMGDFYFIWLDCLLQLEEMDSKMAYALITAMETRQKVMFEGQALLSGLYLDPRINYMDSDFLSDEQKKTGLQHLMRLWTKVKNDTERSSEAAGPSTSTTPVSRIEPLPKDKSEAVAESSASSGYVSRIEAMLKKKHSAVDQPKQDMATRLREMPLRPRLSASECVIKYFWNLKRTDPMLYSLAQVALAVPCTQVSAERSFSALGLILTDKRMRLADENLSNVLFIKLNKELFEKHFIFK